MTSNQTLRQRIRHAQTVSGLTLKEIADKSGYSKSYISRVKNNLRFNPTIDFVHCIATVLCVSPAWLCGWEN